MVAPLPHIMHADSVPAPTVRSSPALFPPTRWSLVVRATDGDALAVRALDELLGLYWQPLYVYARRSGLGVEDAEDAVQGFCESLISRQSLHSADQAAGRLRSFLLGGFQNYIRSAWRDQHRIKRGGGTHVISMADAPIEELERVMESGVSPDIAYDRLWVKTLLDAVLVRLREEYVARGRAAVFDALAPALSWGSGVGNYVDVAKALGLTEAAVQQAVVRLRKRYRALLEDEIAQTVTSPAEAEAERLYLIQILSA